MVTDDIYETESNDYTFDVSHSLPITTAYDSITKWYFALFSGVVIPQKSTITSAILNYKATYNMGTNYTTMQSYVRAMKIDALPSYNDEEAATGWAFCSFDPLDVAVVRARTGSAVAENQSLDCTAVLQAVVNAKDFAAAAGSKLLLHVGGSMDGFVGAGSADTYTLISPTDVTNGDAFSLEIDYTAPTTPVTQVMFI
jgi:hypothetical protein